MGSLLNSFIEKVSTKELAIWVLVFYVFQTVFGYIAKNCVEFNQGLTFVSFIGLYMLGAYIKQSELRIFKWEAWTNFAVYLGVGVLCVVMSMVVNYIGFSKDVYSYISPLQIIQTMYLFLFCRSLTIKKGENIILFFSSSAFAALLMHSWDGVLIYGKGLAFIDKNLPYPFVFTMGFILLFFITACLFDKIRLFVWNRLSVFFKA